MPQITDDKGELGPDWCEITDAPAFKKIEKKIEGPIYVYYQLDNFY